MKHMKLHEKGARMEKALADMLERVEGVSLTDTSTNNLPRWYCVAEDASRYVLGNPIGGIIPLTQASLSRNKNGSWDWQANTKTGREPSRVLAKFAAESALVNED